MSVQKWNAGPIAVRSEGGAVRVSTPAAVVSSPFGSDGGRITASNQRLSTWQRLLGVDPNEGNYWIPAQGEYGLLERIQRRTDSNKNFILLQTCPSEELRANFSWPSGVHVDLSDEMFRLSKVTQTIRRVENGIDDRVTGVSLKQGVREQLPEVCRNSYYLVKYRDYSSFAVDKFYKEAKKDSRFGRKYVEAYFAVRVGPEPGCLIPISEAQCVFGWEKLIAHNLDNQLVSPSDAARPSRREVADAAARLRIALNPTEFESMMALPGPTAFADDDARRQQSPQASSPKFTAYYPSPWDWTPGAIAVRWQTFVDSQYRRLGRFFFKFGILVGGVFLAYYFARRMLQSRGTVDQLTRQQQGSLNDGRRSTRGGRGSAQQRFRDDDNGGIPRSMLEAVLSFDPRSVMDYLLAPKN